MHHSDQRSRPTCRLVVLALAMIGPGLLTSCKVLTVQEDRALRARQSRDFDANAYVAGIWQGRVVVEVRQRAVPAAQLASGLGAGFDTIGAKYGRRAGEGSPWTFSVSGTATVTAVDTRSRRGFLGLRVDGVPASTPIRLQIGPILSGTTVRDGLDFLAFNDFSDQLAYADVGRALNRHVQDLVRRREPLLKTGSRIRFVGTTSLMTPQDPWLITPVELGSAS